MLHVLLWPPYLRVIYMLLETHALTRDNHDAGVDMKYIEMYVLFCVYGW